MHTKYRLKRLEVPMAGEVVVLDALADFDQALEQTRADLTAAGRADEVAELTPHFGRLWPSARGLSEYLVSLGRPQLEGRTFLEVGCGLALPSIVAARFGAIVTAADFHPEVEPLLRHNSALNALQDLTYRPLDWRRPDPSLGHFDFVAGSDVLYDREHAPLLAATIVRHLAPDGRALIADPGRGFLEHFVHLMEHAGFDAELYTFSVASDGDDPEGKRQDLYLLSFSQ